uniref:protein acetyllysine N-acetyltransferase n=1 Tax=Uncultured bacterium HF130_AEPn_1 TaxID=663362 RepID=D0E8I6_UNCHF|nr:NAD-dependent protein deacetylase [uncultured bacterium HF130_AEPn_1]
MDKIEIAADALARSKRALFITGAGLSADSGLPTYRGVGGLYEDMAPDEGLPIEEILSGRMFAKRPELTWKYIYEIEKACRGRGPNDGHFFISNLEKHGKEVMVFTQNVDGFHKKAGSKDIVDIHGDIHRLICTSCGAQTEVENYADLEIPPFCPCSSMLRPDVVLFGEQLPMDKYGRFEMEMQRGFDIVFSIGTSSAFPYIVEPVLRARGKAAFTIEINPMKTVISPYVDLHFKGRAKEVLNALAKCVF